MMKKGLHFMVCFWLLVGAGGCDPTKRKIAGDKPGFFDDAALKDYTDSAPNLDEKGDSFTIEGVSGAEAVVNADGTFCLDVPVDGQLQRICSDTKTDSFGASEHKTICDALTGQGYPFPIERGEVNVAIQSKDGSGTVKILTCIVNDDQGNPIHIPVGATVQAPGSPPTAYPIRPVPSNALTPLAVNALGGVSVVSGAVIKHAMDVFAITAASFSNQTVLPFLALPSSSQFVLETIVNSGDVGFPLDSLFPWRTTPDFTKVNGVEVQYVVASNEDAYGLIFLLDQTGGFILVLGEVLSSDNLQSSQYFLRIRSLSLNAGMGSVIQAIGAQATDAQGNSLSGPVETTFMLTKQPPFYTLKVMYDDTNPSNVPVQVYFDSTLVWNLRLSVASSSNAVGILFADNDGVLPGSRIKDISVYTRP